MKHNDKLSNRKTLCEKGAYGHPLIAPCSKVQQHGCRFNSNYVSNVQETEILTKVPIKLAV